MIHEPLKDQLNSINTRINPLRTELNQQSKLKLDTSH